MNEIMKQLQKPFHPSHVTWKPGAVKGERALALAYADLRAYMNRLDEVCGPDWMVSYEPWGDKRIICRLTINGVTRCSTGETDNESERGEIGGTVAEAQAFKRACAMFGLGRYLYTLPSIWADFDPKTKQFTGQAKAKLTGTLVQHYRRASEGGSELADIFSESAKEEASTEGDADLNELNALGTELYGEKWPEIRSRNVGRISDGNTHDPVDLTPEQLQKLIAGMNLIKSKRVAQVAA